MSREVSIILTGDDAEAFLDWYSGREDAGEGVQKVVRGPRKTATKKTAAKKATAKVTGSHPIRDWAREQGMTVAPKGPIPADIMEAYAKAH